MSIKKNDFISVYIDKKLECFSLWVAFLASLTHKCEIRLKVMTKGKRASLFVYLVIAEKSKLKCSLLANLFG